MRVAKTLQKIMTPIKINKYCGVGGACVWGGGHWGGAIYSTKDNGALSLCYYDKYVLCRRRGKEGMALRGR